MDPAEKVSIPGGRYAEIRTSTIALTTVKGVEYTGLELPIDAQAF